MNPYAIAAILLTAWALVGLVVLFLAAAYKSAFNEVPNLTPLKFVLYGPAVWLIALVIRRELNKGGK